MKTYLHIFGACLCMGSTAVAAGSKVDFHIDGFITAGFGVLTGTQVDIQQIDAATLETRIGLGEPPLYDTVLVRPTLYGYDGKMDFQIPAIVGVSGKLDFFDHYSAVLQITALGANEFDAEIEWGFLEYRMNPNWDFRFGRLDCLFLCSLTHLKWDIPFRGLHLLKKSMPWFLFQIIQELNLFMMVNF